MIVDSTLSKRINMKFDEKLIQGKIQKRYKRFLADVELSENFMEYKKGQLITAHTANTGSMTSCWEPGWNVALSYHDNPKRKLKFSLEMTNNGETWIGINTSKTNKLAHEAILNGNIKELSGYENIKPEAKIGESRIDFLLYNGDSIQSSTDKCYVEVKNVTLLAKKNQVTFPDAVSTRGQKHLVELKRLKEQGIRTCMLYIVQREDANNFSPAKDIDQKYAQLLQEAYDTGVEVLCYKCDLSLDEIKVGKKLKIKL
jgi:sugar fermentation stimulation protein A